MIEMKKIVVPDGMQLAFFQAMQYRFGSVPGGTAVGLEAALRWLSENPPPIPLKDAARLAKNTYTVNETSIIAIVKSGIECMFLAPEPEVPKEVSNLMWNINAPSHEEHNEDVIEAYRRGQKAGSK